MCDFFGLRAQSRHFFGLAHMAALLTFPIVAVQQDNHGRADHEGVFFPLHAFLDWALDWRDDFNTAWHRAVAETAKVPPMQGNYRVRFYAPDVSAILPFSWVWKGKSQREIREACSKDCKKWPMPKRDARWKAPRDEGTRDDPMIIVLCPISASAEEDLVAATVHAIGNERARQSYVFSSADPELDLSLYSLLSPTIQPANMRSLTYDMYLLFGDKSVNTKDRAHDLIDKNALPGMKLEWTKAWREQVKSETKVS